MNSVPDAPPSRRDAHANRHSSAWRRSLLRWLQAALLLTVLPVGAAVDPAPVCSCPEAPVEATPPAAVRRGTLRPVDWRDITGLTAGAFTPVAWQALRTGCTVLRADPVWTAVCDAAQALPELPEAPQRLEFLRTWLRPWQAVGGDGQTEGLATGYYEPVLHGSRTRSEVYRYPLYRRPDDLLTVELEGVVPELKGRRVRARLVGDRVLPYFSRAEIEQSEPPPGLQGHEIAWIDDPLDVFFMQIQGSARVEFAEGGGIHVGYADQNGQPFRSIARLLIDRGELTVAQASLQGMKAWARAHPERLTEVLNANPSYVFFQELPGDLPGPLGTLGVPLVGEGAVAVDARIVPLGAPVYLDTTLPLTRQPLRRIAMAQDTGGAINGAVRIDYYWGVGEEALAQAGRMRQKLRLWVLLPLGTHPEAGAVVPDPGVNFPPAAALPPQASPAAASPSAAPAPAAAPPSTPAPSAPAPEPTAPVVPAPGPPPLSETPPG